MATEKQALPLYIEKETYAKLKKAAEQDNRSMSNWVVVTIIAELKRREK